MRWPARGQALQFGDGFFRSVEKRAMIPKKRHRLWLLLLPYVGLLWVPFYNFRDPMLFGFPFFYWYQLAWVPVTALLIFIAYRTYSHED
jgi:hypothetical protein